MYYDTERFKTSLFVLKTMLITHKINYINVACVSMFVIHLYKQTLKTYHMKKLKTLCFRLIAVLKFLTFKAVFVNYKFDGLAFKYTCYFKARWYSPLYWIIILVLAPISILTKGVPDCVMGIINDIRGDEDETTSWSAEFKKRSIFNRFQLLLFIYS